MTSTELLALKDALEMLEKQDPQSAELVKLRFFAGLSHQETADAMGVTRRVQIASGESLGRGFRAKWAAISSCVERPRPASRTS